MPEKEPSAGSALKLRVKDVDRQEVHLEAVKKPSLEKTYPDGSKSTDADSFFRDLTNAQAEDRPAAFASPNPERPTTIPKTKKH